MHRLMPRDVPDGPGRRRDDSRALEQLATTTERIAAALEMLVVLRREERAMELARLRSRAQWLVDEAFRSDERFGKADLPGASSAFIHRLELEMHAADRQLAEFAASFPDVVIPREPSWRASDVAIREEQLS